MERAVAPVLCIANVILSIAALWRVYLVQSQSYVQASLRAFPTECHYTSGVF